MQEYKIICDTAIGCEEILNKWKEEYDDIRILGFSSTNELTTILVLRTKYQPRNVVFKVNTIPI